MNNVLTDLMADASAQHMSAQAIADHALLDRKTVSSILSGENANPKLETVQAIARALGGDIVYQTTDSRSAVRNSDVSYYRTMISNMQHEIDAKSRWLRALFITCLGLIAATILLSIISIIVVSKL